MTMGKNVSQYHAFIQFYIGYIRSNIHSCNIWSAETESHVTPLTDNGSDMG